MKVLVTGASGFIGQGLLERLANEPEFEPRAVVRRPVSRPVRNASYVEVGELGPDTDWTRALGGVDVLVHAAARVHVMREVVSDPLAEFRRVNVEGTLRLARQAVDAGVRRFVFVSSIKVNGDGTVLGKPYRADDRPAPTDAYGISKLEAEEGLAKLLQGTNTELVVVRPVLVYGPGVKANFSMMMRWLRRRVPLPFGSVPNKRSLVALDNLVDLLVTCCVHPAAAQQTFLVSDDEDLSTTELLQRLAAAMDRPARLVPVPAALMRRAASLLGKEDLAQRLFGSLQVDIAKTRELLDWKPPVTVDEALRRTARHVFDESL